MGRTLKVTACTFCLACVMAIRCFAQGTPTTAPATAPIKAAVPDAAALKDARRLVNEIYKTEIAQAKKTEEKAGLAGRLLKTAKQANDDIAGRYALLDLAKELAMDAGAIDVAWSAVEKMAANYRVDGLKLKIETLVKLATLPKTIDDYRELIANGQSVIDEATAEDRYAPARQAAELVATLAKQSKDTELVKSASTQGQFIREIEAAFGQVQPAIAALAKDPKDPKANLAVGRFVCFMKGDWKKGLPMLAAGSDAKLKAVAEKELANPAELEKQVEVADGWWELADNERGAAQQRIREHALPVYQQALPKLSGLAKVRIEKRLESLPASLQNDLVLDLGKGIAMRLVRIPAGKFIMGSPETEKGRLDREAQHTVTITKPFYMGIHEVTQAQWKAVMGTGVAELRDMKDKPLTLFGDGDDYPMYHVFRSDAMEFCKKVSQKTGKTVRLPTEAEWEYACRAGSKGRFDFGDDDARLEDHAWHKHNSGGKTHPVGRKKPNTWGLYDMHGNVWEWCLDAYKEDIRRETRDPKVEGDSDSSHVFRGGGWASDPAGCRCAARGMNMPTYRAGAVGFRVCVESR